MSVDDGISLKFDGSVFSSSQGHIRSFADIPDIITADIPPIEYIVPALGISRNTMTLWTGPDGEGKTYLAQHMALAVANGSTFLDMPCQKSPVLYVDLENPAYAVQERLRQISGGEDAVPSLRVWGIWNEHQPPQAGSELLLTIAKETKPLVIVDPFRYFHNAEENDSTAMAGVMQYLRACAAYGCAVVILHHPSKAEGSTGRGSSAIRGACDLAFLHSLDKESGLITLKVDKNRFGESRTITIRADFEEGKFDITDSPYIARRNDELGKLAVIINDSPGISQHAIVKKSGGMKARVCRLLKEGVGTRWRTLPGPNRSITYHPLIGCSVAPEQLRTVEQPVEDDGVGCSGCSTLKGREQPNNLTPSPSLPSCPRCGSFAIYRSTDGKSVCESCAHQWLQ
jgi:archaellum biogenesis ATPase FlaH